MSKQLKPEPLEPAPLGTLENPDPLVSLWSRRNWVHAEALQLKTEATSRTPRARAA